MFTRFLPLLVDGDFSRRPRAANSPVLGPIWPNFELVRDVMDVLVTCKYEEDPINQRTNGPVNAHLYGLVKHKTYKTWKIYGKEMTLTFSTHIPS